MILAFRNTKRSLVNRNSGRERARAARHVHCSTRAAPGRCWVVVVRAAACTKLVRKGVTVEAVHDAFPDDSMFLNIGLRDTSNDADLPSFMSNEVLGGRYPNIQEIQTPYECADSYAYIQFSTNITAKPTCRPRRSFATSKLSGT